MQGQFKKSWQVLGVLLASAAFGVAQTSTPARGTMPPPGAVNYVEGQVSLNGENLPANAAGSAIIGPNQVIDTGQGYAEVLLTPGAFLRMGHDSEVRVMSAGLSNVQLALTHGSAMIEAEQFTKGSNVAIEMNGVTTQIQDKGLYSFDTNQQAIRVLDGKATVRQANGETELKKGNEVLLSSEKPLKKRDFDKKAAESDSLYVWSKARSEDESAANINAANRVAVYGGWYGPGWYWDPYWTSYAFLPGAGFIGAPFGWGFYSPGYVWAAPYYGYGFGYFGHGPAFHGGAMHGGMSGFHAAGGFHGGGMGGFHGGGGRR